MLAFENVADILGLPAKEMAIRSPFGLISRIEGGLPVATLDRVARLLAPNDSQFKYRVAPKATYERRNTALRLSSDEGTLIARVAQVWNLALDVWQNGGGCAGFPVQSASDAGGQTTIDVVIQSEIGAELVLDILSSLKYGSAA